MNERREDAASTPQDDEDDRFALERKIAREVEEAFATVPYPGDDRLVADPDYYESDNILETFTGKHWRALSRETLAYNDVSILYFSPEAFRFYLPAYLIAAMVDPPETGILEEYTLGSLEPPASCARRRKWFLEYIAPLDARQKAVIRRFVELATSETEEYPRPDNDRAIYFWQRIAQIDRAETMDEDSTIRNLRKVMLGESPLSEQEQREVKALEQEIAREVEGAFANVELPEDDGSPSSSARWREVPEDFRGKHWRDLSLKVLRSERYRFGHFSPEAFRFFLPAYLIAALLHAEETNELRDELFYELTPPPRPSRLLDLFLARIGALDARQKAAVRRFVELWVRTATLYPDSIKERGLAFWRKATETDPAEVR